MGNQIKHKVPPQNKLKNYRGQNNIKSVFKTDNGSFFKKTPINFFFKGTPIINCKFSELVYVLTKR
jgi:hypothetical protein